MATTTNYSWTTPDNTAYVKDGAAAIRTLGSSVDTSLFSITGGKNVGLVHINTTSLSAISNTTISNLFTSDYANYRIVVTGQGSAAQDLFVRMATTGTPDAGANYQQQNLKGSSTTVSAPRTTNGTRFEVYAYDSGGLSPAWFEVYSPQLATRTGITTMGGRYDQIWLSAGQLNTTTVYDGINFTTGTGTFTGTMRVYGYRNS